MSTTSIPLSDLDYGPEEEAAVLRVLRSRWLSMGPEVQAFESETGALLGVEHALAVSSGTAALHLAYLALDIGAGDEVIQPALNFVAAANTTVAVGATPVFADIIGIEEPTIDPASVERLITSRTRAVVVMHYGGYPCRMPELVEICQRHRLALIEDSCHAVGARGLAKSEGAPHGGLCGAIGDIGCFSFFSNKNLATGEGGMVVTRRSDLAERLRLLRSHGMTTLTWERHKGHASSYDVVAHGFNYRLDELHAALGRCQLRKLQANNRRRGEIAAAYRAQLSDLEGWTVPFQGHTGDSAYHLQVVVAPDSAARETVAAALKEASIQTSRHYPCVADFSVFAPYASSSVERTRAFASRVITLPLYPGLTIAQVDQVCGALRAAVSSEEVAVHGGARRS